eukprot:TRINITY_DN839_c0_g1_i1.p1 TRINITY_DN839_c0_g1~~TRINITY_DN839_c0_g1_i1.p1  ORF type:complete len:643 (+),score=203.02 TRINITY_DN839_c0_g1_i1:51-1979(+)
MAEAQAGAPANANGNDNAQPQRSLFGSIVQMIVMYYVFSNLFKSNTAPAPVADKVTGKAVGAHRNLWRDGDPFEIRVYVSEQANFEDEAQKSQRLVWQQTRLAFNWDSNNERSTNITIPATSHVQNNGSIWAHIFFLRADAKFDVHRINYDDPSINYKKQQLNEYRPKPKINTRKNLISGEWADDRVAKELAESSKQEHELLEEMKAQPVEIQSFWKPVLSLRLVHDFTVFPANGIPAQLSETMQFHPVSGDYYPVIYVDYFWFLSERMFVINDTVSELPLELSYSPISMMKWQLQAQMEQSWKTQETWGSASQSDTEEFKRMLLETNPYLLALTGIVSILHSVFEFLAFKNDINFWQNNKSVEGISVRTIFINTGCQFIIFLYLMDNDTSWLILVSTFIGLLIEMWKIKKSADVTFSWQNGWPHLSIKDKASYVESRTAEYDRDAMRYMSYVFYPLAACYAVYSLMYQSHKSWYSWLVSSLVSFIYTFGFVMMCPQLYLNYKLKSVAHLPWRMLTYKALTTFIDDLFAFIIKMPTMHRLSCFRDDLIFFIYLYQRWIYRVDYTRVNEFGLTPITPEEEAKKLEEEAAKAALKKDGEENKEEATEKSSDSASQESAQSAGSDQVMPDASSKNDDLKQRKPKA